MNQVMNMIGAGSKLPSSEELRAQIAKAETAISVVEENHFAGRASWEEVERAQKERDALASKLSKALERERIEAEARAREEGARKEKRLAELVARIEAWEREADTISSRFLALYLEGSKIAQDALRLATELHAAYKEAHRLKTETGSPREIPWRPGLSSVRAFVETAIGRAQLRGQLPLEIANGELGDWLKGNRVGQGGGTSSQYVIDERGDKRAPMRPHVGS